VENKANVLTLCIDVLVTYQTHFCRLTVYSVDFITFSVEASHSGYSISKFDVIQFALLWFDFSYFFSLIL